MFTFFTFSRHCKALNSLICADVPLRNYSLTLWRLVLWAANDMHRKLYGDRPRGTPPSGELNRKGIAQYSNFWPIEAILSRKRCKIRGKLVLITNRKLHNYELSIGSKIGDLE